MKKLVSALFAVLISVSIAACGGSAGSGDKKNDGGADENVKISSMDDLKTLKISVQKGTQGDFIAQDLVGEENISAQVHQMEKYTDAILELQQNKVQATIMDEGPAKKFIEKNEDIMILPGDYETESYALALKKGSDMTDKMSSLIKSYLDSGKISKIREKYDSNTDVKAADIDMNEGGEGTLTMGTEAGFAPYEYRTGDGIVGVDVEIAALLAKDLNKKLVIEDMAFDALPAALSSGKVDMVLAGMTVTEDRKQNMDFTVPYITDVKQVAVIRKDSYKGQ